MNSQQSKTIAQNESELPQTALKQEAEKLKLEQEKVKKLEAELDLNKKEKADELLKIESDAKALKESEKQRLENIKNETDPVKKSMAEEEWQKFYAMAVLSNKVVTNRDLTELEKRQLVADYEQWKMAGMPASSMPSIKKGKVKIPTAAYRIRDQGKDKIYIYYNDGTIDGQRKQNIYGKTTDPATGEVVDSEEIKSTVTVYDMDFAKVDADNMIKTANKLLPVGQSFALYVYHKRSKHQVSETNFLKPYEQVAEMIDSNKIMV